jgi:hypothetical protein
LALSFAVIYAMLNAPGVVPVLLGHSTLATPATVARDTADLAALLACTVVLTAAAIGLYRPEICIERRRLLMNTIVAGVLAFPAVLVVSSSFNVGMSRYAILWLTKVLFAWLVCMVVSRLIFNRVMRERWFVRRVLVLGSGVRLARIRQLTSSGRGLLFEPVFAGQNPGASGFGEAPLPATLRLRRIWGIVIAGACDANDPDAVPLQHLLDCKLRGVPIFDEAGFSEQQLGRIDLDSVPRALPMGGLPERPNGAPTS